MAVHINPESFVLPAFFGLAYPYILLANIVIVIVWTAFLRIEALISVFFIVLGFTHLSNYIQIGKRGADKEFTFNIMSYNLRLFNYFEDHNSSTEKKIMDFIEARKPDILCIQEVFINGDLSKKESEFINSLGGNYHSHIKVLGYGKNRYYGIATFSRFPVVKKGEIIHPESSSLSIFTDVVIEKDTFRIFNNHLQSFRLRSIERSFLEEIALADDKATLNEIRNLSVNLKKGFVKRARQSKVVKAQINHSPYPVVVAGDFNDTPVSYSYRKIRTGLNDSFVSSGYGAGFTYKGNYPPNRIDYVLYDNNLENTDFETIRVRYSDHYPVVAYFRKRN